MNEKYLIEKSLSKNAFIKSKEIANSNFINVLKSDFNKIIDAYHIQSEVLDGHMIYKTSLSLDIQKEIILNSTCDCLNYQNSHKACKHILALAQYAYNVLKYNQKFPVYVPDKFNNTKDNVYRENSQLIDLINKMTLGDNLILNNLNQSSKIEIIPTVRVENNNFYIRLFISSQLSRKYVLQNFEDFVKAIEDEALYSYGKTLSFYHTNNAFDERSLNLVLWIKDNYKNFQIINREICLSQRQVDSFFKASDSLEINIEFGDESLNNEYLVLNEDLPLELTISRLNGDYYSLHLDNVLNMYKGERKLLIINDTNKIYILSKAYSSKVNPILNILIENDPIIKSDNLFKLLNIVIPYFEGKIIVNNKESFDTKLESLKAEFYFDKLENKGISLHVNYVYKNYQFPFITGEVKDFSGSRDIITELQIEKVIAEYFDILSIGEQVLVQKDEDKQFALLKDGIEELSKYGEIYVSDSFKSVKVRKNNNIRLGVGIGLEGLLIDIVESDIDSEEIKEVYKSFFEGKKYHRLNDGSFISLKENALNEYFDIIQKLGITTNEFTGTKISISKYKSVYLDELLKETQYIGFNLESSFKNMLIELNNISYSDIKVPLELNKMIRNYQVYGYRWLKTLYSYGMGGILADDMGLGKTLQVIALLLSNIKTNKSLKNLVVCPASLVYNWQEEIRKFTSNISIRLISGNANNRKKQIQSLDDSNVIITSYDSLKRDIELYKNIRFDLLIADEAQYIKNHETLNSKLLRTIKSNVRFALTGTPIENNLSELWSIFDFILPGYLLRYSEFSKRFETPIVSGNDMDKKNNFKKIISPFILRRLKKDVLVDLPEKIESVIYSEMFAEQENLYNSVLSTIKDKLNKQDHENDQVVQVLAMLTRLRQIVCDPKLLNMEKYYNISSAKKELCMDLIKLNIDSGHRIIVFSNFASMIDILSIDLKKSGIEHLMLVGSTPAEKRHLLVNRFNESNIPVFLISLKAGGVGLNLTGADTVIHFDPWWNLSAKNQATDRAYRIGQERNVQVYSLIAKNTIEEKIMNLQMKKGELADTMLNDSSEIIKKLTIKDILSMLG